MNTGNSDVIISRQQPQALTSAPQGILTAASTDAEMVETFLRRFDRQGKPSSTRMQYEKELRRFCMWISAQQLRFADLKDADCVAFLTFCRNVSKERNPDLVGSPLPYRLRSGERNPDWRPFQGPLSDKAINYTARCLASFFNFMCNARYLNGNPWKLLSKHQTSPHPTLSQTELPIITLQRSLEPEIRCAVYEYIESIPTESDRSRQHRLRCNLIMRLILNTGLRREEACKATMGDLFQPRAGEWALRVLGKGNKVRTIPLSQELVSSIRLHRTELGLSPYPTPSDANQPLIGRIGDPYRAISVSAMHKIVKQIFLNASTLPHLDPMTVQKLLSASTHWLRHTFATEIADGSPLPVVSNLLGHTNINTTRRYITTDFAQMKAAIPKRML